MEVSWNGVAQHGWFVMENPAKMDDLGYTYFGEPPYTVAIEHGPFVVDLYIIPISIGDLA